MAKLSVEDVEVEGRRVLVRVDFNVPIEQGPEKLAEYDHRLRATLPTIEHLLHRNCRLVLCSHLGRPRGRVVEGLRMAPVAQRLSALLSRPVGVLNDCIGHEVEKAVAVMREGDILMLENLRFHPGEEGNDPVFAGAVAAAVELFVMDAFAVAHRAHASTVGVPKHLPSVAGLLVRREVEVMGDALESPARPLAAVLGGAKVSDKITVLGNLVDRVDRLFIGGGMAATFLRVRGHATGASLVEEDSLEAASRILDRATERGIDIYLPSDVVIAIGDPPLSDGSHPVPVGEIPDGWKVVDIGPDSVARFVAGLGGCGTLIWNGPMGIFEVPAFASGTEGVARATASLDAITIVGGGSTAEAVEALGLMDQMTHVSTGGGASLEFLEGRELPGIAALPDRDDP